MGEESDGGARATPEPGATEATAAHRAEAVRQSRRRNLNEQAHFDARADDSRQAFRCECDEPDCSEHVTLSESEYETVRSAPTQFLVRLDHENPATQAIVTENRRFANVSVVTREGRRVAQARDGRTPPNQIRHRSPS